MSEAIWKCRLGTLVALCLLAVAGEREALCQTPPEANGADSSEAELAAALFSPVIEERYTAVTAIAALGDPSWVEPLTRTARSDASPTIRGWAVRALHRIGTPEALACIERVQRSDPDSRVALLAGQLLMGTSGAGVVSRPAAPADGGQRHASQAELATRRNNLETANRARRITNAGFALAGIGTLLTVVGPSMVFASATSDVVGAGIAIWSMGMLSWTIDTPLFITASRRMEEISGRSRGLRVATMVLYITGIMLTAIHLGTGFLSEEAALIMPAISGTVATTTRIMSLVLGARANRDARDYLEPPR